MEPSSYPTRLHRGTTDVCRSYFLCFLLRKVEIRMWFDEKTPCFFSLFLLVLSCCNSISLYLSSSVSRFNFQPNTKSILVCWSLKSKKTYCSCRQIRLRSSMILKGISAFPIGRLGARMKDYEKRKILLRVIHESLCLSVPIKQIFLLLIIRKMLRKTYILHNSTTFMFRGALWICEEKFNLEILLLWKIEMHLLGMELFVDNCKNTQCLEIFLVRLYQFFTVLKFLSNTI